MKKGFLVTVDKMLARKSVRILLIILVAALFVYNDSRLIAVVHDKDLFPVWVLIPAYLGCLISVVLLLLNSNIVIRTFTQVLLFSAIYTDSLYLIIAHYPFSYPDAINLFNNPEYAAGAFITFMMAFLLAFAVAAVGYALVQFSLKNLQPSFSPWWLIVFITIHVLLYLLSKPYAGINDYFPSFYRVSANLLSGNSFGIEENWRRAAVKETPGEKKVNHLFLVVDESVTGTTLSVNGFPVPTTPFLQANAEKFINFGTAASFTNFSSGSNFSFLSGMRLSELPDKKFISFSRPSIFQYAKNAGYQTYLLNGQASVDKLQNYTSSRDLASIDSLFQPGILYAAPFSYSRDSILAEKIAAIANSGVPTFTYVNKAGAHWPYHTNFPAGSSANTLTGLKYANHSTINSYYKSIYWNVDRFWKMLERKLPGNGNILILYTSDHGENYASPSFVIKHASIYKTPVIEGLVPLLAFDRAGFFPPGFRPPLNRYSHEYIFPTLLSAMGYDSSFIQTNYGRTLLDSPYPGSRWFYTGDLFGRGKNNRVYVDRPLRK